MEDDKKKDNKLINTKITRPQLIRKYTKKRSPTTKPTKTISTTNTTNITSLQMSNHDINPIGEINIALIDKSNDKSYMSYGSNNEIHIDSMSDNLIHTSLPAFTEYVIEITNVDACVDVYYTLEEGRVNNRSIIINSDNNIRIQCFDKFKLKGYRLQPKNPNGSAFISYKNSDSSLSKHNQTKYNTHTTNHDNMIELIFKKWLMVPIPKVTADENADTNIQTNEINYDMKLFHTLMFRIKIDCIP